VSIVMLLSILVFVFGVVGLVSYFWFVVLGFRRSALWGIGLLFLQPITTIVYAVKHWDEARRPTFVWLTGMAGTVTCFGLVIALGVAEAVSTVNAQGGLDLGSLDAIAVENVGAMPSGNGPEGMGAAPAADVPDKDWEQVRQQIVADAGIEEIPANAIGDETDGGEVEEEASAEIDALLSEVGRRSADGYLTVSFGEANRYVGGLARIVQTDGREYHGMLVSADGSRLWMERPLAGGTFTVEFQAREISTLAVLPNTP
jgi:hypothetical protein